MLHDSIHIADYDYALPDSRIAKYPLEQRDAAKLLVYQRGTIGTSVFARLCDYIPRGTLMVFNNTRVIHARLLFRKNTGALIEVFLLEPSCPADYEQAFHTTTVCAWQCLVGNLKKWKGETLQQHFQCNGRTITLSATYRRAVGAAHEVSFTWDDAALSWAEVLDAVGELPLPPYLNREAEEADKTTYQTIYSKIKGSVAAPTAGLHFTSAVLAALDAAGIEREELTLHVGAGTFRPVKSDEIHGHEMHAETIAVRRQTIERLLHHDAMAVAVGTTTVRTLESLYYIGVKVHDNPALTEQQLHVAQWEPYEQQQPISATEALQAVLAYMDNRRLSTLHTSTQVIIVPGYEYKIVKALITNFHQPRSTLLLLVAALIGDDWRRVYDYALAHDYRFLSYGDACLLLP